jgi:exonuclease VII small subunit
MSDELNYEALYNTAQQELANAQHTIRVLVQRLQEAQSDSIKGENPIEEVKAEKKKAN